VRIRGTTGMGTTTAAPVGRSLRRFGRRTAVVPKSRAGHTPTIGMRIHGAARKLAGRLTGSRSKVISGDRMATGRGDVGVGVTAGTRRRRWNGM